MAERLEERCLLAISFGPETAIVESNSNYPRSVIAADLDGDDDADLVVASFFDDKVAWYENTDGEGTFGPQKVISTLAINATKVFVADLDDDGDLDVLSSSGSTYDSDVSWYKNDGAGNFGEQQLITADVQFVDSIATADVDGDGDLDVLSASYTDNKIAWYENTDGLGTFGEQVLISEEAEGARTVVTGDLDNDGDVDVVSGSALDETIRWFENTDGEGTFTENIITDSADFSIDLRLADLDADGHLDIVSSSQDDDTVSWFRYDPDAENFDVERVISLDENGPDGLFVTDIDGDGRLDVLVATRGTGRVVFYPQVETGLFGAPVIISDDTPGAASVTAFDMDADGDLDVASASRFDNKVAVYEHLDGQGSFASPQVLTTPGQLGAQTISTADVDGDGDLDVLYSAFTADSASWSENLDGTGTFGPARLISDRLDGAEQILAVDLDGDGDLDALSGSFYDDKVAWYENLDGKGNFGLQRVVGGDLDGVEDVWAEDLDGDDDLDVLAASRGNDTVAWFENLDGKAKFGPRRIVSVDDLSEPTKVRTADLDGDGDPDVIANGYDQNDSSVKWYENTDGLGTFGEGNIVTEQVNTPTGFHVGDLDSDGDLDLVTSSGRDDKVAWYENTDGEGTFGDQLVVFDDLDGAFDVQLADLDDDGDLDILAISLLDDTVGYFENRDGSGDFGPLEVISDNSLSPSSVIAADIDGDDDLDVLASLSGEDKIAWFANEGSDGTERGDFNEDGVVDETDIQLLCDEFRRGGIDTTYDLTGDGVVNRVDFNELITVVIGTTFGDSNLDGTFDSQDFVMVFQAGEFEDTTEDNSTWGEGDWNCDGDFTTADLTVAFVSGGFVSAAKPANHDAIAAALADLSSDEDRQRSDRPATDVVTLSPDALQKKAGGAISLEPSSLASAALSRESERASARQTRSDLVQPLPSEVLALEQIMADADALLGART